MVARRTGGRGRIEDLRRVGSCAVTIARCPPPPEAAHAYRLRRRLRRAQAHGCGAAGSPLHSAPRSRSAALQAARCHGNGATLRAPDVATPRELGDRERARR